MDNIEYSIEAAAAKGLFYNKKYTVYVEGDDDVMFWSHLFDIAKIEAHIEEVGGSEEISKKITEILDENASFIVACDLDHSDFLDSVVEHNQIIRTYGYSIENSMYYSDNIEKAIQKLGKKPKKIKEDIEKWALTFSDNLFDLLVYDVANQLFNKGVRVFGDNCIRFLNSNKSIEVCNSNVQTYIDSIKNNFSESEIEIVTELIKKSKKEIWFHLKGHFITHGIINLIQHYVKEFTGNKCSISHDSLYALTIDCSQDWNSRIDIKTVVEKIEKLKSA
jgi:hypothetical protein